MSLSNEEIEVIRLLRSICCGRKFGFIFLFFIEIRSAVSPQMGLAVVVLFEWLFTKSAVKSKVFLIGILADTFLFQSLVRLYFGECPFSPP